MEQRARASDVHCVEELLIAGVSISRVVELFRGHLEESEINAIARQVTKRHRGAALAVTTLKRSPSAAADTGFVSALVSSLSTEAPEELQDPLFGEIMRDPGVLSSGFIVDRHTVLHEDGRLKFSTCPWSKVDLQPQVYPLVALKTKLKEFKTGRLNAMITAAKSLLESGNPVAEFDDLMVAAESFLDDLGDATYIHEARKLAEIHLAATRLPNRKCPPQEVAKIYERIHRTLGPHEISSFEDEVKSMEAGVHLALAQGHTDEARLWCEACENVRRVCKVPLAVSSMWLDLVTWLLDQSPSVPQHEAVHAIVQAHETRRRLSLGTVRIPCHVCGCYIGRIENNPFGQWICDCPTHVGNNRLYRSETLYGCATTKVCDWGLCQDCWHKELNQPTRVAHLDPQAIRSCSSQAPGTMLSVSNVAAEKPFLQCSAVPGGGNRMQERWVLESLDGKTYGITMTNPLNECEYVLCPSWSSNDVILRTREDASNYRPWQICEVSPGKYTISALKMNPEGIPDGKWKVRIEGEGTIDITLSGKSFEAYGSNYTLDRTASPMSITWSDGTVQSVRRIEGCTVEWTTTCEDYPAILWELIDRHDTAGTSASVGERHYLTINQVQLPPHWQAWPAQAQERASRTCGDGKVVLSVATEETTSNQVWMLDRVFAESLTSETARFFSQVERLAASARLALAEGRLEDAVACRDAHAKVHADCGLPLEPVIQLRTEIGLVAPG
mmetsp:Transcript_89978/g.178846  ORF Transcript_89978/g.178846 Transcript_89978/m.178846 type:complete len:728 (+) Transcript_89978:52-2235(+)